METIGKMVDIKYPQAEHYNLAATLFVVKSTDNRIRNRKFDAGEGI